MLLLSSSFLLCNVIICSNACRTASILQGFLLPTATWIVLAVVVVVVGVFSLLMVARYLMVYIMSILCVYLLPVMTSCTRHRHQCRRAATHDVRAHSILPA